VRASSCLRVTTPVLAVSALSRMLLREPCTSTGASYLGVSRYFTVDARVRYRFDRNVSGAFGIDNLNNDRYWNFHPYPQRSYVTELKIDL
jgi:outer membrane receptor for ferric coprogen and ferric-rhodotorulic acid